MTEILALIPARGGSKGIPRKNIKPFAGYPLIAWSIAAGLQAKSVSRVIVSTDDEEIAAVAREFGAEVPFLRPAELAQDRTTDLPVFEHALKWLEDIEGYKPEIVVQLRPTSPLRPVDCVDSAVKILVEHPEADCVRGIVPAGQNPFKMWRFNGYDSPMSPLLEVEGVKEPYNAPRQILPPVYWQTGHIDAIRTTTIARKNSLTGDIIYPLVIDPHYTVDIDTPADWAKYEALVHQGGLDMVTPDQRLRRPMPRQIELVICDFDGVFTDNRVWTDQDGTESVAASRSDSIKFGELRERGIEVLILSSEPNPVVSARAKKMKVEAVQGIGLQDKGRAMREILEQKNVKAENVVYVGNDVNDLPCFEIAGWSVAVADAYPEVLQAADFVLSKPGGHGAVRELCELILKNIS
ncbi:MAG: acylneuraminate cytidylyltransferase [Anaerolineales bacterium]|nr:acylneuraminate cytidylyltransferase [Anaerolineae bacterium]PWB71141.1 MAG: acylneuraminate cytidylyltransferase [Anaerolineales bacterium]